MSAIEPQAFSAQALFTIADNSLFNSISHKKPINADRFGSVKDTLANRKIVKLDPFMTVAAAQVVARAVAALFITIFVAPVGVTYHLGKTAWHFAVYATSDLFHTTTNKSLRYHEKAFKQHFTACIIDTLAAYNGSMGIFLFANLIALHFAWNPNKVGAVLLTGNTRIAAATHLQLAHRYGVIIHADKVRMNRNKFAEDYRVRSSFLKTRPLATAIECARSMTTGLPNVPNKTIFTKPKRMLAFFDALEQFVNTVEGSTWGVQDLTHLDEVSIPGNHQQIYYALFLSKLRDALKAKQSSSVPPTLIREMRELISKMKAGYQNAAALTKLMRSVDDTLSSQALLYYALAVPLLSGKAY